MKRKNLGDKGKEINDENKNNILKTYLDFKENEISKIFDNKFFCYTKVQIEQPIIEKNKVKKLKTGEPKPDVNLRGYERVPANISIEEYFDREVKPYLPNSWMDRTKDKVGYEISFNKVFYKYKKQRDSKRIKDELLKLDKEINQGFKNI